MTATTTAGPGRRRPRIKQAAKILTLLLIVFVQAGIPREGDQAGAHIGDQGEAVWAGIEAGSQVRDGVELDVECQDRQLPIRVADAPR